MVQANSGTLTTRADGSTALIGRFSGLNTEALVNAAITAQRLPATSLERQISQSKLESAALTTLNKLLGDFRSAADKLRNPPGVSALDKNSFRQKTASLQTENDAARSSVVSANVQAGAQVGRFQLEILQTAKAHKLSSVGVTDAKAALNITDTVTLGLAGATAAEQATLSFVPGESLEKIAAAINGEQSKTGIRASVLKLSATESRLVLSAEKTGQAIQLSGTSGEFLTKLGTAAGALETVQSADKAQIKVDGLSTVIERDSNDINDVITGVELRIAQAKAGAKMTLDVGQDTQAIKTQVEQFVKAYNDLRDFYDQQRNYDPQDSGATKPALFSSPVLRDTMTLVGQVLGGGARGVPSGTLSTLRGVGIKLNKESKLEINQGELDSALTNNPQEFERLFAFSFESSSPDLRVLTRTQAVFPDDFDISITESGGQVTGATVGGRSDLFEFSGRVLTGKKGTKFEGLKLFYGGTGTSTIEVKNSVGVAERLYNSLDRFIDPGDGQLTKRLKEIEDSNKDRNNRIAAIDARLVLTKKFLINKYAKLERDLAQAEASRKQLEAFLKASNKS